MSAKRSSSVHGEHLVIESRAYAEAGQKAKAQGQVSRLHEEIEVLSLKTAQQRKEIQSLQKNMQVGSFAACTVPVMRTRVSMLTLSHMADFRSALRGVEASNITTITMTVKKDVDVLSRRRPVVSTARAPPGLICAI